MRGESVLFYAQPFLSTTTFGGGVGEVETRRDFGVFVFVLLIRLCCFQIRITQMRGRWLAASIWPSRSGAQDRRSLSESYSALRPKMMLTLWSPLGTCGFRPCTSQWETRKRFVLERRSMKGEETFSIRAPVQERDRKGGGKAPANERWGKCQCRGTSQWDGRKWPVSQRHPMRDKERVL